MFSAFEFGLGLTKAPVDRTFICVYTNYDENFVLIVNSLVIHNGLEIVSCILSLNFTKIMMFVIFREAGRFFLNFRLHACFNSCFDKVYGHTVGVKASDTDHL